MAIQEVFGNPINLIEAEIEEACNWFGKDRAKRLWYIYDLIVEHADQQQTRRFVQMILDRNLNDSRLFCELHARNVRVVEPEPVEADPIEQEIEKALPLIGEDRTHQLRKILYQIADLNDPIEEGRYLTLIVSSGLSKIRLLRRAMKQIREDRELETYQGIACHLFPGTDKESERNGRYAVVSYCYKRPVAILYEDLSQAYIAKVTADRVGCRKWRCKRSHQVVDLESKAIRSRVAAIKHRIGPAGGLIGGSA